MFALGNAYTYIRELEAIVAIEADRAKRIKALLIQRNLDQTQIARLEIEVQSLKARLPETSE